MKLRDLMSTPAYCVRPDDDVAHARREMMRRGVAHMPVVDDDGSLEGFLSVTDFVTASGERGRPALDLSVERVMSTDVTALEPGATDTLAIDVFRKNGLHCAPVVNGDRVIGVVSAEDLLGGLTDRAAGRLQVADVMRDQAPSVHRHASMSQALQRMEEHDVRELLVLEGRSSVPEGAGSDVREMGIVGTVSMKAIAFSAWFDQRTRDQGTGKRISEARKGEPAGRKDARHVRTVDSAAEDMMNRDVPSVGVTDDAAKAAKRLVDSKHQGIPVLGDGMAEPGFLVRSDVLYALADASA